MKNTISKGIKSVITKDVKERYKMTSDQKLVDIDIWYDEVLEMYFVKTISISKNHVAYKTMYKWDMDDGIRYFNTIDVM